MNFKTVLVISSCPKHAEYNLDSPPVPIPTKSGVERDNS